MRPPIREISANQFVSSDRPGWRAYSGTPLPDFPPLPPTTDSRSLRRPLRPPPHPIHPATTHHPTQPVGAHRHAPSDTRDLRKPIRFKRSILAEGVQRYAPTRFPPIAADNRLAIAPPNSPTTPSLNPSCKNSPPHPTRRGASPCALRYAKFSQTDSFQAIDLGGGRTAVRPYPAWENRFLWGQIAMRPPIREISEGQFVSGDRSWRRAYSGTPLPSVGKPILVGSNCHAPSDTRDLRGAIRFRRSTRLEGVPLYAPTR